MGIWHYLAFIGVGAVVGLFSGLLGIGGGTIVVPAMVLLFAMSQQMGQGTSLAAMVPVALVGAICYGVQKNVHLVAALLIAASAMLTAGIGANIAQRLPENVLRYIFALFLVIVAAEMVPVKAGVSQQAGFIGVALLVFAGRYLYGHFVPA